MLKELKIKGIAVEKFDRRKSITLSFDYVIEDELKKITKSISPQDGIINFVKALVNDIKKQEQTFLEISEGEEERVVNIIERLMKAARDIENIKDYTKHMQAYNRIVCFKHEFKI